MRDRLGEIRGPAGGYLGKPPLDSHSLIEETSHPFISEFFETVELIKSGCKNIEMAAWTIDSLNDASLGTSEPESFDSLERVVLETNAKIVLLQKLLVKMTHETDQFSSTSIRSPGEKRIRSNLTDNLTHKFVTVVRRYQASQLKYRSDLRKMFVARLRTVKSEISTEQIERMLQQHTVEKHKNLVRDIVLKGAVSDSVSNTLTHTTDIFNDIQRLELSIQQLHEIFLQMSQILEQQNELLNQIQYQVEKAVDYLDEGNEHLAAAIAERNKKRGICCCCWPL